MSRCHPFPPPGYEKKAAQPPELVPSTKEKKHKHKDKEKKKKRRRDDGDENAHKEKRSSKHQKAANVANDVHPANGRVHHEAPDRQPGQEDEAGNSVQVREATRTSTVREPGKLDTREPPGKLEAREPPGKLEAREPPGKLENDKAGKLEVRESGGKQVDRVRDGGKVPGDKFVQVDKSREAASRVQPGDRGRESGKQVEARGAFESRDVGKTIYGESSDHAEKTRESDRRVVDKAAVQTGKDRRPPEKAAAKVKDRDKSKEINGRIPSSVAPPKHLDTGQQQPQKQRDQRDAVARPSSNSKPAGTDVKVEAGTDASLDVKPNAPESINKAVDTGKKSELSQKEIKAAEKEERRSRFLAPIDLQPIANLEEDNMDWLVTPTTTTKKVGQDETVVMDAGDRNVWAEPMLMSSVDIYALPYVVPY